MEYNEQQILLFFLILVRLTSMFMVAPIFSYQGIPNMLKIGVAGIISILLFPIVDSTTGDLELMMLNAAMLIFREILAGLTIGFGMSLLFAGIQLAGELIAIDMGLSIAQVLAPETGQQVSIIARMKNILAMLVFLILDGHHFLIEAVAFSYELIPTGEWAISAAGADRLILMTAKVFIIGVKFAAPAIVALFITSIAMGITARTVPQMNIFFVSFPIRILVGFTFLSFGLSFFVYVFRKLMVEFQNDTAYLLKVF